MLIQNTTIQKVMCQAERMYHVLVHQGMYYRTSARTFTAVTRFTCDAFAR